MWKTRDESRQRGQRKKRGGKNKIMSSMSNIISQVNSTVDLERGHYLTCFRPLFGKNKRRRRSLWRWGSGSKSTDWDRQHNPYVTGRRTTAIMRSRPQGRPDRNWLAVATKRRAKLCFLSWKWRWESVFILFFNAWDCVRGDLQPQTETDGSSPVQFISRGDVTAHVADQIRLFTCFTCRRRNNSNTCLPSFTLCFIWPFYFSGVVSWDQNLF